MPLPSILRSDGTDVTDQIVQIFKKFIRNAIDNFKEISLEDFDINPFLLAVIAESFDLKTPSDIARFLVSQRSERSLVTSLGKWLQDIAKLFSEATGVEGADIMLTKDGIPWYIQVKSGPNTVNKDICEQISDSLQSAIRRHPGSAGLLGICYGRPERVSSIARKYFKFDYKIGKDFWEFLSGSPTCMADIYTIARIVAETYINPSGLTFKSVTEAKVSELAEAIGGNAGETSAFWINLIE